jgi:hypothetical protein
MVTNLYKKITLLSAAACGVCGLAFGQSTAYTNPVGYATQTLSPGFSLTGLTLQNPTLAVGTFDANNTVSLTDDTANFSVNSTSSYIVEMLDTSGVPGVMIEVPGTAFSATTISGLTGITSSYLGGYKIRVAATIAGIFGNGATCVLKKGTSLTADLIYAPNSVGGFDTYFHSADVTVPVSIPGKWQKVGGGSTDQFNTPLNYLDAFYVQVRGSAVNLVVTGEVKLQSTSLPAINGFSYFSSVYPTGSTLGSSGLAASVLKGTSLTADLISMPNGSGGFDTYFHTASVTVPVPIPGKWQKVGAGSTDQTATPLTSGFILQRRGVSANIPYAPPASYTSLE